MVLWGTRTYQLSLHLTSQTWNLELDSPIKPVRPTCPSNFILPVICPVPRNMFIYIGVNWHFRRVKLFTVDRLSYTLSGVWVFRLIILAEPPGKYDNQKKCPYISQHPLEGGFTGPGWQPLMQLWFLVSYTSIMVVQVPASSKFLVDRVHSICQLECVAIIKTGL